MTRRLVVAGMIGGLVLLALTSAPRAQSGRAASIPTAKPGAAAHTFALGANDVLLDGQPFQLMSCEMHPARIPAEYWTHRIRMAKAMGCFTSGSPANRCSLKPGGMG